MQEYKFNKEENSEFLKNKKIAIIIANFYDDIGAKLLQGAKETLNQYGCDKFDIFYVPGAFEVPLMAKNLAEKNYDGIVTLGAVIQGETPHFDFVCNECASGISKVSDDYNIPVSFGVLTTNNMEQTLNRAGGKKGNKGVEATIAMIEMLYLKEQLKNT
ncbi:6,7-dimethyl-8-ribityllumazine synthase [hydrothermal vent metagenome]|uniref:6,7-dimethyl-8-ribityllumazine synthase n=1 Tax=hydrothermal vent metagenome TaxID=652676 RepID=A0A1W1BVX1_9ZZZZ